MAYTTSPYAPRARRKAVNDVRLGRLTAAQAAVRYGVHRVTLWRWLKTASRDHRAFIYNKSAAPHTHPHQVDPQIVKKIVSVRKKTGRCAQIVHAYLVREGVIVSLSTVKRVIFRQGLTRKGKRPLGIKNNIKRPKDITYPGQLVQMDTIHIARSDNSRFYIFTVIDVCSRLAYAWYSPNYKQYTSVMVALRAQENFGFSFNLVQTDNGHEFGQSFQHLLLENNISFRHSRVRKPNDNAHIERFNRTLQEECFKGNYIREKRVSTLLQKYLTYYNEQRLHLSLNNLSPREFVAKLLS